jgi:putative ABC transport system substrate-binding protein
MKRREFIAALGGAAAWPLGVGAQQTAMPVVGLLNAQTSSAAQPLFAAFRRGLGDIGFVEGRNISIVYRSAEGNLALLPELANELVRIPVSVIAAVGGDKSALSAKAATAIIPIVFTTGGDPVEMGIVASLNRPDRNVTGATFLGSLVVTKQIGILRDMVTKLATIGVLGSGTNPMTPSIIREAQAAAQAAGLEAVVMDVKNDRDIDDAFARFVEQHVDALVIANSALLNSRRDRLIELATRHAIPAIDTNREFPANGGLMSYGADLTDTYRQAGVYVGRILRGEKPADLPVMQPTRFQLVINLKTSKALGLTVPASLYAIADEVIE